MVVLRARLEEHLGAQARFLQRGTLRIAKADQRKAPRTLHGIVPGTRCALGLGFRRERILQKIPVWIFDRQFAALITRFQREISENSQIKCHVLRERDVPRVIQHCGVLLDLCNET
jgi:hypothetical protein